MNNSSNRSTTEQPPAPDVTEAQLEQMTELMVGAFGKMNDAQKKKVLSALEVAPAVKKPKNRRNNHSSQQIVRAFGDVVREDPNWRPVPPEHVVQKGPEAMELWYQKWEDNEQYIDDDIAATASM